MISFKQNSETWLDLHKDSLTPKPCVQKHLQYQHYQFIIQQNARNYSPTLRTIGYETLCKCYELGVIVNISLYVSAVKSGLLCTTYFRQDHGQVILFTLEII